MSVTIYEVFKCEGCGRPLPDPGHCAACEEEIRALDLLWLTHNHPGAVQLGRARVMPARLGPVRHKPELPGWVYSAGAVLVFLLLNYIIVAFLTGGW